MKITVKILTFILLIAIILTGCNQDTQVVSTDGSTSMERVIGFLSEAYAEKSNKKVTFNPTGSGAGIKSVSEGRCDIGLSSRNLQSSESDTLDYAVLAIDAIAIIVNPKNPIVNLSMEQVSKIYTGKITNWEKLGLANASIVLIGREAASGTRDGFEGITNTIGKCNYTQELTSNGDVIQTVASNPNAIGYTSLASVKNSVKIVSIDNVFPSKSTVQNSTYKIQRNFLMITPKNKELSPEAKDFFDFATSQEAKKFIEMAGAIPVAR